MSGAFTILESAWYAVYNWTINLFNSMNAWQYVMAAIVTMLVIRFAVYPFMKNRVIGASDMARRNNDVVDAEYRRL